MRLISTSILVMLAAAFHPPVIPGQEQAARSAFLDSDGVRIRYLVRGSGPPVLLVHGFSVDAPMNWAATGILDTLATRYTVIAPDLRGHGASDKPREPGAYGIQFVEDLVRLLDHLEIARAHVVGYSMGAAIALKLLAAHPQRVASTVLGGAGWRPAEIGPPEFVVAWLDGLERAARSETRVADVIRRPDGTAFAPEIAAVLNRNDPRALAAVLRGGGSLAVREHELRASPVPILVVVGENDPVRTDVSRLRGVLDDLDVVVVPETDHFSAVSHPQFLQAILQFIGSQ